MMGLNTLFRAKKLKEVQVQVGENGAASSMNVGPTSKSKPNTLDHKAQPQTPTPDLMATQATKVLNETAEYASVELLTETDTQEILVLVMPGMVVYCEQRLIEVEREIKFIKTRLKELYTKRHDIVPTLAAGAGVN